MSKFPPPKKLTPLNSREKLSIGKESVQAVQKLSPERKNLLEYRKIMRHVGRGDVHERTGTIYAEVEDFTNEVARTSAIITKLCLINFLSKIEGKKLGDLNSQRCMR